VIVVDRLIEQPTEERLSLEQWTCRSYCSSSRCLFSGSHWS